jgi:hypothetical protein
VFPILARMFPHTRRSLARSANPKPATSQRPYEGRSLRDSWCPKNTLEDPETNGISQEETEETEAEVFRSQKQVSRAHVFMWDEAGICGNWLPKPTTRWIPEIGRSLRDLWSDFLWWDLASQARHDSVSPDGTIASRFVVPRSGHRQLSETSGNGPGSGLGRGINSKVGLGWCSQHLPGCFPKRDDL